MVMRSDVLAAAVDHALEQRPEAPVLAMTPRGRPLTQRRVRELASGPGLTIICGRFEGIDERLFEARPIEPISIGDYILSGGETAIGRAHVCTPVTNAHFVCRSLLAKIKMT